MNKENPFEIKNNFISLKWITDGMSVNIDTNRSDEVNQWNSEQIISWIRLRAFQHTVS